jgi:hypothetical protein|tara:strand:+ start:5221 stop:5811 length:591 start_codon:yes stop_codon:yes gene_type:complete
MPITNGYATLAEVKAAMRIIDSVDDDLLELAIDAASRQIDGHCERVFYSTDGARIYTALDNYLTEIDDLAAITELKTSSDGDGFDTTWAATDYQLEPLNGQAGGISSPATFIRATGDYLFPRMGQEALVKVTGTFGWSAIPIAIKQATLILAQRQFKRYDSPLGVAGIGDIGIIRVSRIDPDVASLIAPFRRRRVA